jgi:hypothetical protein
LLVCIQAHPEIIQNLTRCLPSIHTVVHFQIALVDFHMMEIINFLPSPFFSLAVNVFAFAANKYCSLQKRFLREGVAQNYQIYFEVKMGHVFCD